MEKVIKNRIDKMFLKTGKRIWEERRKRGRKREIQRAIMEAHAGNGGKMKTVWKYRLGSAGGCYKFEMPEGAKVLTVQIQKGTICIWVLVNPENQTEIRKFRLFGTGHPIQETEDLNYIGSFQLLEGDLVFHLFEIK